jgi:hypothetical protein
MDIWKASARGDHQFLAEYISEQGDINLCTSLNETALIVAACNNRFSIVIFLLENGADPNIQDAESGWSALHHACFRGCLVVASALLDFGVNHDLRDHMGQSAFELCPMSRFGDKSAFLPYLQKAYLSITHAINHLDPEGASCISEKESSIDTETDSHAPAEQINVPSCGGAYTLAPAAFHAQHMLYSCGEGLDLQLVPNNSLNPKIPIAPCIYNRVTCAMWRGCAPRAWSVAKQTMSF